MQIQSVYRRMGRIGVATISLFIMVCGCGINKQQKKTHLRMIDQYYKYVYDDAVKLHFKLPGDYESVEYKKDWLPHSTLENLATRRNFLSGFETTSGPRLSLAVFKIPLTKINTLELGVASSDSVGNEYYSLGRSSTRERLYILPHQDSVLFFMAFSESDAVHNLSNEFEQIVFPSIRLGDAYMEEKLESPFRLAKQAFTQKDGSANYLRPIVRLQQSEINYKQPQDRASFVQASATFHSFIENGSTDHWVDQWRSLSYLSEVQQPIFSTTNQSAFDVLIAQIKDERVTMFNEAHFVKSHRLLMRRLLRPLYELGYRHLAIEGLWEDSDTLQKRGYPIVDSGFYVAESNMAALIREALQLGYHVTGYDDFSPDRERLQAQNLYNNTILNQEGKVLVLAGFGHIHESSSSGRKMMAEHFRDLSGIDPFTIDQVEFNASSPDTWLGIVNADSARNKLHIGVDLSITNNLHRAKNPLGRVDRPIQKLSLSSAAKEQMSAGKHFIAQWFHQEEYRDYRLKAVPITSLIVTPSTRTLELGPQQGTFVFCLRDLGGRILYSEEVMY